MKADLETAVGHAGVDLVFAFDPHLGLRPAAAIMDDRPGAPLAGLAMADVDARRLARGNHLELAAMALSRPFHVLLPGNRPLRAILRLAAGSVERPDR